MDALDLRILRDIGLEPFASGAREPRPWRVEPIAARLKENPRLVKDRVHRLERDAIAGYEVVPNLGYLGLAQRTYAFPYGERAERRSTLERLGRAEGVLGLVDYVTDWLTVTLAWSDEDEHRSRVADASKLLGDLAPETWFEPAEPEPRRALARLDLRILQTLRATPKAPASDVAADLGVSTKTLARRLDRLGAEGAFDTVARLSPQGLDEVLFASLVMRVDMARARDAMGDLHGRLLAEAWAHCSAPLFQGDVHYDLVLTARSPRGLAALLEETARIPGILAVTGHVAIDVRSTPGWLDGWIAHRLEEAPA